MLADFLNEKHEQGARRQYLGVLRSAVSMFSRKEGLAGIGSDPRISDLMKGIWREKPPRPKYNTTWSVDTILSYYSKENIPSKDLDLKGLTIKVALLLSISMIGRADDLIIQGIIAEKGFDVKLSRGNVIPSLNGSI